MPCRFGRRFGKTDARDLGVAIGTTRNVGDVERVHIVEPGDLLGTGTISGPADESLGSLMEISQGGKTPITLPNGETRSFLEDGDEIILKATARADGAVPIGFGECRAVVMPARA